jgi:hypothetical protein
LEDIVLTEKPLHIRHGEERSDEAISPIPAAALKFKVQSSMFKVQLMSLPE